jgi:hypothetical protein
MAKIAGYERSDTAHSYLTLLFVPPPSPLFAGHYHTLSTYTYLTLSLFQTLSLSQSLSHNLSLSFSLSPPSLLPLSSLSFLLPSDLSVRSECGFRPQLLPRIFKTCCRCLVSVSVSAVTALLWCGSTWVC